MGAVLAWLIPALVSAASTWWSTRQANERQGWQDNRARLAWDMQEKRRVMLGASVMSLLERRPDLRDRIPQPLLDWITRPSQQFTGQTPTPSPWGAAAVSGFAGGAAGWAADVNRSSRQEPVGVPGLNIGEDLFSVDAPFLGGQTASMGAMHQLTPPRNWALRRCFSKK